MTNMSAEALLTNMETQVSHIENLKTQVIQAKKLKLHTGLEGFDSPDAYGIYKHTGGKALGVVGSQFEPMDLQLFLDTIMYSVLNSGLELDLSKLEYKEYYEGSKVSFRIPLKKFEIQTKMVGDILETALDFRTGFDGRTKAELSSYMFRLWCSNGAARWEKNLALSMKNTKGNVGKLAYFTNEILTIANMTENHVSMLNKAAKKPISQADINRFFISVFGYDENQYHEMKTRSRNILDSINQSVAIEMQNTGANLFSLLQGVTRYTTHELAQGDEEAILFGTASTYNQKAHEFVFAELN